MLAEDITLLKLFFEFSKTVLNVVYNNDTGYTFTINLKKKSNCLKDFVLCFYTLLV